MPASEQVALELERGLTEDAGLPRGVRRLERYMRAVLAEVDAGNERAGLAIDTLVHRTAATVGGTIASLGGLDALVFTGGIGEHSSMIRKRVCAPFGFLGLHLDRDRKARIDGDTLVSRADSHVLVLVVEAREDLVILRALKRVLRA